MLNAAVRVISGTQNFECSMMQLLHHQFGLPQHTRYKLSAMVWIWLNGHEHLQSQWLQ